MADALLALDRAAREWVVLHRVPPLDAVMLVVSGIAFDGIGWIVAGAIVAWRRRRAAIVVAVAAAVLGAGALSDSVLKRVVPRERPFLVSASAPVIGPRPHDSSFPSGHTATSFAGATMLSACVPEARVAWWTAAIVVAYSRLYLGVHYPLDVVGGALLGAALGLLVARALPRLAAARRRRRRTLRAD
jgi:undecaprenyl-diphosphatase